MGSVLLPVSVSVSDSTGVHSNWTGEVDCSGRRRGDVSTQGPDKDVCVSRPSFPTVSTVRVGRTRKFTSFLFLPISNSQQFLSNFLLQFCLRRLTSQSESERQRVGHPLDPSLFPRNVEGRPSEDGPETEGSIGVRLTGGNDPESKGSHFTGDLSAERVSSLKKVKFFERSTKSRSQL